ncbi:MAG: heparinase II/III family protein [Pseudomonadota bacterium]
MFKSTSGLKFNGIKPLSRLTDQAKAMAFATPLYNLTLMGGSPDDLHVIPTDPWPGQSDIGQDLLSGRYMFAGEVVEMDTVNWEPQNISVDWLAEFHRFNWLRDLKAVTTNASRLQARQMISDWIDTYDRWHETIWRPDVMGCRLSSWIGAFSFYGLSADEEFQAKVRASIARQTRHLARVINDGKVEPVQSFAALKGLIYAMIAIGSPKKQLEHPFKLVIEQIDKQILPDGGHVSRSPLILSQVLTILIDLRTVLNLAKLPVPGSIQHAIDKMVPALRFFRYADGSVGNFNGGYEGNASLMDCILNLSGARGKPLKKLEYSGYSRLRQGRAMLMVDTGTAVDSVNSRSVHAAPLAFEFAFGRERVIVNCGAVSEFGEWHDALRSTAAHSTLVMDQHNACHLNSDGCFGGLPEVTSSLHEEEDSCLLEGCHDGYLPRYGAKHSRRLLLKDSGNILIGEDKIIGGNAGVPFTLRFHLHPTSQASLVQNGEEVLIQTKSRAGWRFRYQGEGKLSLQDSVYIGRRQQIRRSQQIVIEGISEGAETCLKWGISRILS